MIKKEEIVVVVILIILVAVVFVFVGNKLPDISELSVGEMLGFNSSNINEINLDDLSSFCGDGKCSYDEEEICKLDCDWCGDGFCKTDESCSDCSLDCGDCNSASYCGDDICSFNECKSACWKDCSFSECENGICEIEKEENCVNSPNDCSCENGYCDSETKQCVYQTCGNKFCDEQETFLNCPNDCYEEYLSEDKSDENYPIIFVHGHSTAESYSDNSVNAFKIFQEKLEKDNYAINKGILLPKGINIPDGSWGRLDKPISVRTTFYLNAYDEFGSTVGPEDNQPIDVYAQRLGNVVDLVLKYTGKNKVIILSHSMGGLVARDYIKNYGGAEKVDKLVMFGTPNHGVFGDLALDCEDWFGGQFDSSRAEPSPECNDMANSNGFITKLNSDDKTPGDVKYLSIIGNATRGKITAVKNIYSYNVCPTAGEYHDEVVCVSSAYLEGAENYYVKGNEVAGTLTFHEMLIYPSKVSEAYRETLRFLGLE